MPLAIAVAPGSGMPLEMPARTVPILVLVPADVPSAASVVSPVSISSGRSTIQPALAQTSCKAKPF